MPKPDDAGVLALIVLGLLVLFAYFIPAFAAWERKHHNKMAITALNLLLGWTLIGWIAALVWAFTAVREEAAPPQPEETGDVANERECPFCQAIIRDNAKVCSGCGRALFGEVLSTP
ncbi:MAG: superinfection immunity protein [Thiohalocapsa sp.]